MTQFGSKAAAIVAVVVSVLTLSCLVTVSAAAPTVGDSVTPESVESMVPSRDFTVANAAQVLPAGYEKSGNNYIYEDGAVIITTAAATQELGCVAHYLCLYRDADYSGHRWMFQDEEWQNLRRWNASDVVSSWKNRQGQCDNGTLGWNSTEQGITPTKGLACTHEQAHMGNWNDEASSVHG